MAWCQLCCVRSCRCSQGSLAARRGARVVALEWVGAAIYMDPACHPCRRYHHWRRLVNTALYTSPHIRHCCCRCCCTCCQPCLASSAAPYDASPARKDTRQHTRLSSQTDACKMPRNKTLNSLWCACAPCTASYGAHARSRPPCSAAATGTPSAACRSAVHFGFTAPPPAVSTCGGEGQAVCR